MVELGKIYDLGRNWGKTIQYFYGDADHDDLLINREKAVEWLWKAAEQGDAEAQGRLGRLFREGNGVQQDFSKALEYFLKASARGDPLAQFGLGMMYLMGDGISKDEIKSQELIRKSAAKGLPDAQLLLATWYSEGFFGVAKDALKAMEWWQKAAEQGNASAQYLLGSKYKSGEGVPQDNSRAMEWLRKSASQGFAFSQHSLGTMYADASIANADNVLAYAWFNLASGTGDRFSRMERDSLGDRMAPLEVAEAQRLSSNWKIGQELVREGGSVAGSKLPVAPSDLLKTKTGTAFIVNAVGHAITNHHVVEGCAEVRAEGRNGVVKVATYDSVNDLALLQIPGVVTAHATIANDPAKVRQGEDIVVFGYPLNAVLSSGGNLTPGVISALTGLGNNTNQLQITAPIQPGSSGSPVISNRGEVVGVVSMKLSDSKMAKATGQVGQNVNFAVSGQTLKIFLDTHKVEYRIGGMFTFSGKSAADLADDARSWTLVVECWK